jgi:hypothetical protein
MEPMGVSDSHPRRSRPLRWTGFAVSAVLLRRRVGWRRAGGALGMLMLGLVVLYIVLVELHSQGYFGGT